MNIKKGLMIGLAALGFSMSANAVNVGGVIWNPSEELSNPYPSLEDFNMRGSILEDIVGGTPGEIATGYGKVLNVNSQDPNSNIFCPGCELTFTFSMELVSFDITSGTIGVVGNEGDFEFTNLVINFYVDGAQNYVGTEATAEDGNLWLRLTSDSLSGSGASNLGTGSDSGNGSALLNVEEVGLAWSNFDTNLEAGGYDMVLDSSFQGIGSDTQLGGSFQITGDSIPEPTSIALLALGLLGFAARRKA